MDDQTNILTEKYTLILLTRARCYSVLQDFKRQFEVIDRLLHLVGWTQGRQNKVFKKLNERKKLLYEANNKEETEKDKQKKQQLSEGYAFLNDLSKLDNEFKLDFDDFSVELYE